MRKTCDQPRCWDREHAARSGGWVFFDRGLVDAAALEHAAGEPALDTLIQSSRYYSRVFLTPPWPEMSISTEHSPLLLIQSSPPPCRRSALGLPGAGRGCRG
ncbi:AAA family ATPase [Neorhizobium sp. SOG26]|uniref:AAA family ATPase n=1 Tax=Neorhizobium sp. SOG26 TaxID=2060726 RepID=UPI0040407A0F